MKSIKLVVIVPLSILALSLIFFVYEKKWTIVKISKNNSQVQELSLLAKNIQEEVQLIDNEKDYQIKTLNNEQFLGHMTDGGGQLIGYFKNGKISKIIERLGLSYGVKTYEYYFLNEKLILVSEKEEDFPDTNNTGTLDYTKVELAFEGHYYFNEEKLITAEITGKKRFPEDAGINLELLFLKRAKENIGLLLK